MRTLMLIALVATCTGCMAACADEPERVQHGADVSPARTGTTPPLREIVPPPQKPEHDKVHEVKPVPRPHRDSADGGVGR